MGLPHISDTRAGRFRGREQPCGPAEQIKIGLLTASVSRRGGGVYEAVRGLGSAISATCQIRTQAFGIEDQDIGKDFGAWNGIPLQVFPARRPVALGYAPALRAALNDADVDLLHVHGLWKYPSIVSLQWARFFERPLIVSPHGMLDPWAVRHSHWKKRIARLLYQDKQLRRAACLHALCVAEADAIRTLGFKNPIVVIPNGVNLSTSEASAPPSWQASIPEGDRVVLYLGRLHAKKNLVNLLRGWEQAAVAAAKWWLVISGWDEGGYEQKLKDLVRIETIPRVVFGGPQFGANKVASLRRADGCVLASHSEGLPLAVLEAWAYRLPVVMTTACHLPQGVAAGAAIVIDTDAESIARGLARLIRLDDPDRRRMGAAGRALVELEFGWPAIARRFLDVYRWVLGRGDQPESVMTI